MTKVAVVTGSSSGIGFETSLLLARNQFTTYATMRNLKKSTDLQEVAAKEQISLKVLPEVVGLSIPEFVTGCVRVVLTVR
jgi:NAD(P)-dependent dehydrogenase (short-subunit alcohol dehydrogenase family)